MTKVVMSGSMEYYDLTYLCNINDMIWYDMIDMQINELA